MCQRRPFGIARWPGLLERFRHPAEISVNRREHLVFSELGRITVAVTRRSVFVVSHGGKVQSQAVHVRRRCADFL